jgi:hypothetical protein
LLPAVREHSYLQGSLQVHYSGDSNNRNNPQPKVRWGIHELAVLEKDIVVFPGDTLPVRLRDVAWIKHLESALQTSEGKNSVTFGLIANIKSPSAARRSWTRMGAGPRQLSRFSQQLRAEMDGLRDIHEGGIEENDDEDSSDTSVSFRSYGDVDTDDSASDLSLIILRRNIPPAHQALRGDVMEEHAARDDMNLQANVAVANNIPLEDPRANNDADEDSTSTSQELPGDALPDDALPGNDGVGGRVNVDETSSNDDDSSPSSERSSITEVVRDNNSASLHYSQERIYIQDVPPVYRALRDDVGVGEHADRGDINLPTSVVVANHNPPVDPPASYDNQSISEESFQSSLFISPLAPGDDDTLSTYSLPSGPIRHQQDETMVGRIGTIMTVLYTHRGDDDDDGSPTKELTVTAIGTSRFQILACRNEPDTRSNILRRVPSVFQKYLVEELYEDAMTQPASLPLPRSYRMVGSKRQRYLTHNLALLTPLPAFCYYNLWPWRIMNEIQAALQWIPSYEGILGALPAGDKVSASEHARRLSDPIYFSYWIASNLALQQSEQLHLLQLKSVFERLQYIQKKILEAEQEASVIHCRVCNVTVAHATQVFTVGGAEGTAGNYVNRGGFVHQTITVRRLFEDVLRFQGRPETKDSWFPGYSHQIMCCCVCGHHLGWKFQHVENATVGEKDRPVAFYGLSRSNIDTYVQHVRSNLANRPR